MRSVLLVWNATQIKLVRQGFFVDRLQKPRAEDTVHFHSRPDACPEPVEGMA